MRLPEETIRMYAKRVGDRKVDGIPILKRTRSLCPFPVLLKREETSRSVGLLGEPRRCKVSPVDDVVFVLVSLTGGRQPGITMRVHRLFQLLPPPQS